LLLYPDPETLTLLPWLSRQGRTVRLSCDIKKTDGTPFEGDSRALLKRLLDRCRRMGFDCLIGAELEFYLFKTDENGDPTEVTIDCGGYLDISPQDRGENIRQAICLNLEQMGIALKASHHQRGPGQNAIRLDYADPLSCADNILSAKSLIKDLSAENGLFASFMPKPIPTKNGSGIGLTVKLNKNGLNLFNRNPGNMSGGERKLSPEGESFISGILAKIREITLFTNPIANSYERFGALEAPKHVSWSDQSRAELISVPPSNGPEAHMELCSPDPSLNPYLAFALLISAGLDGIESGLPLPPAAKDVPSMDAAPDSELLPRDLCQAVEIAGQSEFVKTVLGQDAFTRYMSIKSEEASAFRKSQNKREFFREKYFKII
jgi:glutamine synthetase